MAERSDVSLEKLGARRRREYETVAAMIALYCRDHHQPSSTLCEDCEALQSYALRRLARCLFDEGKPVCVNCTVHCYSKTMRERIRAVMRYAGPRMLYKHPWLALRHGLDTRRRAPTLQEAVDYHRQSKS